MPADPPTERGPASPSPSPSPEAIAEAAADGRDPWTLTDAPEAIALAEGAAYADRLALLQRWQARGDAAAQAAVTGAIRTLEGGAALDLDAPETPEHGYGAGSDPRI